MAEGVLVVILRPSILFSRLIRKEDMTVEPLPMVVLWAVRQEVIVEQKHKRLFDSLKENGAAIVAAVESAESVTERDGYIA